MFWFITRAAVMLPNVPVAGRVQGNSPVFCVFTLTNKVCSIYRRAEDTWHPNEMEMSVRHGLFVW